MTSANDLACAGSDFEFDPVAAYCDGYQQSIERGWPSPDHLGTEPFEYGLLDGTDRWFGEGVMTREAVEDRLLEWEALGGT